MILSLVPILADAHISSGGFGEGLIILVAAIIVLAFLWWVNNTYVPPPIRPWGVLIIVLMCVLAMLNFVLSLGGHAFFTW
jgi:hypothetical protein